MATLKSKLKDFLIDNKENILKIITVLVVLFLFIFIAKTCGKILKDENNIVQTCREERSIKASETCMKAVGNKEFIFNDKVLLCNDNNQPKEIFFGYDIRECFKREQK